MRTLASAKMSPPPTSPKRRGAPISWSLMSGPVGRVQLAATGSVVPAAMPTFSARHPTALNTFVRRPLATPRELHRAERNDAAGLRDRCQAVGRRRRTTRNGAVLQATATAVPEADASREKQHDQDHQQNRE